MNDSFEQARNINWNIVGKGLKSLAKTIAQTTNNQVQFELYPSNSRKISDWHKNRTYDCITQTMYFKDNRDTKTGIGFVYNVIKDNCILIAPIGTEYLNNKHPGLCLSNEFMYLKPEDFDKQETWQYLFDMLWDYITYKYN